MTGKKKKTVWIFRVESVTLHSSGQILSSFPLIGGITLVANERLLEEQFTWDWIG